MTSGRRSPSDATVPVSPATTGPVPSDCPGPVSSESAAPVSSEPAGAISGHLRLTLQSGDTTHTLEGDAARSSIAGAGPAVRAEGLRWLDLQTPSPALVAEVAAALGLHPLIAEDIVEGNQRSKIEVTEGLIHVVLFALEYRAAVVSSEIDIVLGRGFLLTVHDAGWDPRASTHLREGAGPILARGPDHLLWALCDGVVDGYFPFLDRLGDAIDEVQDEVIRTPSRDVLDRIFTLKRELLAVRRAASPIREIFSQLTNRDLALIDAEEVVYFRDVYDHVIRLTDELDNYRELVSGTLDVYLTQVNNNLSLIMKRLTGVTVIIAGVGSIAGIFGMSEAATAFVGREGPGFWLVALGTVVAAVIAAGVLRRIDWI